MRANDGTVSRRRMLALAWWAAMPGALRGIAAEPGSRSNPAALAALDRFIAGYCEAMNAPALSLALADRTGPIRTSAYGQVDINAKVPATTAQLFEIGSISKSFAALVVLQLHEQGKVDLQAPIQGYLPWLSIETDYGDILVHHLLTHSSGMPEDAPVFPPSPERRLRQAFVPGSEFHYSNWGYAVLGHLIERLDGRPWPMAVGARILKPLGMTNTSPSIDNQARARLAPSYVPLHDDRPYPRHGPLAPAGNMETESTAGSIASTPGDMALYMRMLLNRGAYSGGRIVSEESFRLFSSAHIAAPDFGPAASYGYGIAVDELDGHRRLRHTGGMISFMSAIHLDLDEGIGAFASINAQLGYRPNPVAEHALRLLRASRNGAALPAMPPFDEAAKVESAAGYQGVYTAADGRRLEVTAAGERVFLSLGGQKIALQHSEADVFLAAHEGLDLFPLVFERAPKDGDSSLRGTSPVTALAYGPDWYAHASHPAPTLERLPELERCAGAYYSDNPWNGWVRVVQRQQRLWLNGTDPLTPIGNRLFRVGEKPTSPETAEFTDWVDETPRTLRFDGGEFGRIEVG